MRAALILISSLAFLAPAAAAPAASEEEIVYRNYLVAFKAMKNLDDDKIEKYLSKAALKKLADYRAHPPERNCSPCPSPEEGLKMAKEIRPYPKPGLSPARSISGGIAKLTFKWHDPSTGPGHLGANGLDITIEVELVKEGSWKLKSESWTMAENPGTASFSGRASWSY